MEVPCLATMANVSLSSINLFNNFLSHPQQRPLISSSNCFDWLIITHCMKINVSSACLNWLPLHFIRAHFLASIQKIGLFKFLTGSLLLTEPSLFASGKGHNLVQRCLYNILHKERPARYQG